MGANRHMSVESRGRYTPEVAGEVMPGSEGPAGSRSHNLISARRASLMQEPVLVLNATYEPINVTAVRRAMVLMLKGVAQAGGAFRSARAQSPVRDPPAGVPPYSPAEPRAFAEKHFAAGSQYLPVLCAGVSQLGANPGPRCAEVARRTIHLGKPRGLLLQVQ